MDEEEPSGIGPREAVALLYRRRYWLIVPAVIGTLVAALAALLMKPTYESTATILIESQQIPTSLVASPVTSYADERIAKIRQQILSRDNLIELIDRNRLYPEERGSLQLSEVIELMRSAIVVDLVSADMGPGGRGGKATIAFKLGFRYSDPQTTQSVTEQLAAMFIDADMRRRTEQASGTAAFLSRRADELRERLTTLETRIAQVRAQFNGALPEQVLSSTQSSATLRGELARIDLEMQTVMQNNSAIAAQMEEPLQDTTQAEIARAEAQAQRLEATYSDTHPDVVAAREVLRRLRSSALETPRTGRGQLAAELQAGRSRLNVLNQRRAEIEASLGDYERLVSISPQAAYQVNALEREHENLNQQYQSIRDRQLEAQVAANLEAEEKGERFTLVEAPALPEKPVSPDLLLIILTGFAGGLGLGFAAVIAAQVYWKPVLGPDDVARITGTQPLGAVPLSQSGPYEESRGWIRKLRDRIPARLKLRTAS